MACGKRRKRKRRSRTRRKLKGMPKVRKGAKFLVIKSTKGWIVQRLKKKRKRR